MADTIQDLERKISVTSGTEKVDALNALAQEFHVTETSRAIALTEEAQALAVEINYNKGIAESLRIKGFCIYRRADYVMAETLLRDALRLFVELGDRKGEAGSLGYLGLVYSNLSDYEKALDYYHRSLVIHQDIGNQKGEASVLNYLGIAYHQLSDYEKALSYYHQSIKIQQTIENRYGEAAVLNNIGLVYFSLSDYKKALAYHEQSLAIHQEIRNRVGAADAIMNIGVVYFNLLDYEKALSYFKQNLKMRENDGEEADANLLNNIASVYAKQGDYQNARLYTEKSLEISRQQGNRRYEANALRNLGEVYQMFPQAVELAEGRTPTEVILDYMNKSLAIATDIKAKELMFQAYQHLSEFYEQIGDAAKALDFYKKFYTLRQEVFNEESDRRLKNLEITFSVEQTQKEAELYRLKNIDLVEANRFKTELLSLAAHDLKAPLQSIMGFAQLIQEADAIPQHIEKKATVIVNSAKNMERLIVDLLDTAAMEQGKIMVKKTTIGLAELAKDVVAQYQPQAEKKKQTIQFHADETCEVETDADKTQRILENLISNAVKYSPEGKTIWVSVAEANSSVQITVRDEGQGFTEADKEKLFQKFQRLSARPTGGENSTGLGLAIAKQLVELLGGSIRCDSAGTNQGATFIVDLPH
jgi:signal transduction histidine kinase